VRSQGGEVAVTFSSLASRCYTLRASLDLVSWSDVTGASSVPGNDGLLTLTDILPWTSRWFYRVAITRP